MKKNQTKGIAFIVGGILSFFTLPWLCRIFTNIPWNWPEYYYLTNIIALVITGFGIKELVSTPTDTEEDEPTVQTDQTAGAANLGQSNKVVKVTLVGGLIGLLAGSPVDSLNKRIRNENSQGWEVVQVLPDTNLNLLTVILRILLLMITLLLYTTTNGYFIVLKRKA